ncbi:MAG: hypothetical protein IJY05_03205 [Clostridia bacterium]|nr:hypothetical protein [Clostridia bacterium]
MKRIKYVIAVMALSTLFLFGFTPCLYYAVAEEATETPVESTEMVETPENTDDTMADEEIPETEENGEIMSDTVSEDEEVKDITLPVVCGVTGLSGVALLFLLFKGKLKKIGKAFDAVVSWFTKKQEEVTTEELDLKKIEQSFASAVSSNEEVKTLLQQAYERNKEEYDALCRIIKETVTEAVRMVEEMKACYDKKSEVFAKQYEQIKTILIKIATGSAELVRHGVADEVVKLIEKDTATEGV